MDKQIKRPFLLTGLIVSIVVFVVTSIICFTNIFDIAKEISDTTALQNETVIKMLFSILILACSICGTVFSAISIPRINNTIEEFSRKKGFIITCFALNILVIIFSIVVLAVDKFNVLLFIMLLALVCASVFIALDFIKNEKLKYASKTESQNTKSENKEKNTKE